MYSATLINKLINNVINIVIINVINNVINNLINNVINNDIINTDHYSVLGFFQIFEIEHPIPYGGA